MESAKSDLRGDPVDGSGQEDRTRDTVSPVNATTSNHPLPSTAPQAQIEETSYWVAAPSDGEDDSWVIRRAGETHGASVAQMLWKSDALRIVRLHNQDLARPRRGEQ